MSSNANERVIRQFAERLAGAILTVHGSEVVECQRAQLMRKLPNGSEENMGGRCKASIVNVIVDALMEW